MGRSARQVGFVSQEAWQRITHDRCTCRNDASFSRERIDILEKIGVASTGRVEYAMDLIGTLAASRTQQIVF